MGVAVMTMCCWIVSISAWVAYEDNGVHSGSCLAISLDMQGIRVVMTGAKNFKDSGPRDCAL